MSDELPPPGAAGFGARLRVTRQARGLSQSKLAALAGERPATQIRSLENGRWRDGMRASNPTLRTVEELARHLGVSAGWLAYGDGPMGRDGGEP